MPLDIANLPPGWAKPTPAIIRAVEQASKEFVVPEDIIYSVIRKESNFNPRLRGYKHGGNSPTFSKSWEKWRTLKIPNGRGMTWGQMFPTKESWRPYGLMQLMPYHVVGKSGGVRAGAPLTDLFDVQKNIRLAAAFLKVLFAKHGNWFGALREYNGAKVYARQVLAYAGEIGGPVG